MLISFGSHLKWQGPIPVVLLQLENDHLSEFHVNFIWYDLLQNSKHNFSPFALCSHKTPMALEQILHKIEFDFMKLLHKVGENSRNHLDKSQFLNWFLLAKKGN